MLSWIKGADISPLFHSYLVFTKKHKIHTKEKEMVLVKPDDSILKARPIFFTLHKTHSKWTKDLNVVPATLNMLQENVEITLQLIRREGFLNTTLRAQN